MLARYRVYDGQFDIMRNMPVNDKFINITSSAIVPYLRLEEPSLFGVSL
jgi:hypothetical protein